MAVRLLRKVESKRDWAFSAADWVPNGDQPGAVLRDFCRNEASVYEVTSDEEIRQVAAALTVRRDSLQKFDCIVFDETSLSSAAISYRATAGNTPDPRVNLRHRDLIELTVSKTTSLVRDVYSSATRLRFLEKQLAHFIAEAIHAGEIGRDELSQLSPGSRAKVDRAIGTIQP